MLVVLIREVLVVVLGDKAPALVTVPNKTTTKTSNCSVRILSLSNFCIRLNDKIGDYDHTPEL